MARLDQVIGGDIFFVDEFACIAAADAIRSFTATSSRLPWSGHDRGTQFLFKLLFVSICHQINWDFLQSRLAAHFLVPEQADLLESALQIDARGIESMIGDYHRPERVQAGDRAKTIRAVAAHVKNDYGGDVLNLYEACERRIGGESGLRARLNKLPAFRDDPLSKKSNVLIQEVAREGILEFVDENQVEPAIDYHLIRIYLRTGRVVPSHEVVMRQLQIPNTPTRMRLLDSLRRAVANALKRTAYLANLRTIEVNYIDWQLGRARCDVNEPNCIGGIDGELDADVDAISAGRCPHAPYCRARTDSEWRRLSEPTLKRSFY